MASADDGWTVRTLRELIEVQFREHDRLRDALREADREANDERFVAAEKAVQAALVAAERAVEKAEADQKHRADASNEIRGAMLDQQTRLASKQEVGDLERRVEVIEQFVNRSLGRSSGVVMTGDLGFKLIAAFAAVAAIVAVAITILR